MTGHRWAGILALIALIGIAAAAEKAPASPNDDVPAEGDLVSRADELISDRNYDSAYTDRYRIKTDDPRFDVDAAADLLESFRTFFEESWGGRITLRPYEKPGRIYLFYSRFKYRQLLDIAEVTGVRLPVGHYTPSVDIVTIHTDSVLADDFADVLVHEAAHHLVQQNLYGPDRTPAPWLAEGLASYFGHMARGKDGAFQPGRIGGKGAVLFEGARPGGGQQRLERYRDYRKIVNRGEAAPLSDLTGTTNPASFYSERQDERYAASWMLVHFLLHGADGARAEKFFQFLEHDAAGDTDAHSMYRDLGARADAIQDEFEKYVLKLKVR